MSLLPRSEVSGTTGLCLQFYCIEGEFSIDFYFYNNRWWWKDYYQRHMGALPAEFFRP